ncbi:Ras subfamily protein [Acanthamoeba castellanii str. Neff]|uniref:Ras subfamily protein n=1 Tax=Acanthamoeba castellanii (strain ATCC 30010 / Neff) TaxID=1257118 RepID=L8GQ35_ACACF|nr:Ras subfamily protein [Acanthamoeba castellanii str. Neff]ELR14763.1 Ras subfamily protein [Acanthamoeba castellanii str. Neff]
MDGQALTIVVLGMGGVGKSALTLSYVKNLFVREYGTKQVSVDDQVSVIDILDTAGTEDHMVMRDQWFRAGDGFLLVYSVDEPSTLQYLCELRVRMLDCLEVASVPMAIAANKTDLPPELHRVTLEQAKTVLAEFNCQIIETSAKNHPYLLNQLSSQFALHPAMHIPIVSPVIRGVTHAVVRVVTLPARLFGGRSRRRHVTHH